jgi:DNA-binding transcriptional LysR family regulator
MKVDYLRYFLAAATHGSFSTAGVKMHISPTSIGYAVNKLEEELQATLFVRTPSKGLTLTPDGAVLQEWARQLLSEIESIENHFSGPDDQFRGELVVGCQEGLLWSLMPRVIRVLADRHPELRISMISTDLGSDFALLDQGKIDVLLTFVLDPSEPSAHEISDLCQPELFAMMREGHPLDDGAESNTLAELAAYPHVFNNEPTSFDLVYETYKQRGLTPTVGFLSNMSAGAQAIVGSSDCISPRFLRPVSNLSPLGDALIFKRIKEKTPSPAIVVAKVKSRATVRRTKHDAFVEACNELFDSGEMRAHCVY